MRELKFRAWDKEDEAYLHITKNEEDGVVGISPDGKKTLYLEDGEVIVLEDIIIEQYTGLKDKNGKEIYEGDILRLTREAARDKSTLYQVVWIEHIAGFDTKNLDKKRWDIGYLNETAAEKDYLVIGNIHENKELLGG